MADKDTTTGGTPTTASTPATSKPATSKPARAPGTTAVAPTDMVDPAKTSAKATADFSQGATFVKKGDTLSDELLAGMSHADLTRLEKVAGVISVSKRG